MEPQENMQIALRKAINAHEAAEAAVADLIQDRTDPRYLRMIERIRQNIEDLNLKTEQTDPGDRV